VVSQNTLRKFENIQSSETSLSLLKSNKQLELLSVFNIVLKQGNFS